jgi:hypothetical protein
MKYKFYLLFSITFIAFTTCKKEEKINEPFISIDFKEYVVRFATEAAIRGKKIDMSRLSVSYSDTLSHYCGWGDYNSCQVSISSREYCWFNRNDLDKEVLMFHELGHALLELAHDNSRLPNGDFTTIMNQGNLLSLYSEFTPEKRKYYLDKLFIPSTPQPDWAVERKTAKVIFMDTINAASTSWIYVRTPGCTNKGELSSSAFVSPGTCLAIKSDSPSASADDFSCWMHVFNPQGIKQSTKLVFLVNVKLADVTNGGVYLALRGNSDSKLTFFNTTQGVKKITGTSDFIEYSVEVPYYISLTQNINLFLILDGQSTGTTYFDDITLINYE